MDAEEKTSRGAAPVKTRAEVIADARAMLDEIELHFSSVAHWNRTHPDERPIDPDPDGQLRRVAENISHMLVNDKGRGPLQETEAG